MQMRTHALALPLCQDDLDKSNSSSARATSAHAGRCHVLQDCISESQAMTSNPEPVLSKAAYMQESDTLG
jgi:hypothetical protein